jgi:hypothetical protein
MMQRRRALKVLLAGSGVALAGGAGALYWSDAATIATFPDTDTALGWLDTLARDPSARSLEGWPLAQVLEHAAQSIEYSLEGYPALRAAWFRHSIGPVAFGVFSRRGRMSHDTGEPIPGAPALSASEVPIAAGRLVAALQRFEQTPHGFVFAPHFAYGQLDKSNYRRAHLMHLADHARLIARS